MGEKAFNGSDLLPLGSVNSLDAAAAEVDIQRD